MGFCALIHSAHLMFCLMPKASSLSLSLPPSLWGHNARSSFLPHFSLLPTPSALPTLALSPLSWLCGCQMTMFIAPSASVLTVCIQTQFPLQIRQSNPAVAADGKHLSACNHIGLNFKRNLCLQHAHIWAHGPVISKSWIGHTPMFVLERLILFCFTFSLYQI